MKGNKLKVSIEEFRNLQRKGLIDQGVTQEFFHVPLKMVYPIQLNF